MRTLCLVVSMAVVAAAATPVPTAADTAPYKLLPNYSRATFKVRAKFGTTFTNHGMQIPQLLFLKVNNEIQLETDLTFVRQ